MLGVLGLVNVDDFDAVAVVLEALDAFAPEAGDFYAHVMDVGGVADPRGEAVEHGEEGDGREGRDDRPELTGEASH